MIIGLDSIAFALGAIGLAVSLLCGWELNRQQKRIEDLEKKRPK